MKRDIIKYVQACEVCQRSNYESLSPIGLLQPLLIPTHTWFDVAMDFLGELPRAQEVDIILVLVDRFTSTPILLPTYTVKEVATVFVKEVVILRGFLQP